MSDEERQQVNVEDGADRVSKAMLSNFILQVELGGVCSCRWRELHNSRPLFINMRYAQIEWTGIVVGSINSLRICSFNLDHINMKTRMISTSKSIYCVWKEWHPSIVIHLHKCGVSSHFNTLLLLQGVVHFLPKSHLRYYILLSKITY